MRAPVMVTVLLPLPMLALSIREPRAIRRMSLSDPSVAWETDAFAARTSVSRPFDTPTLRTDAPAPMVMTELLPVSP